MSSIRKQIFSSANASACHTAVLSSLSPAEFQLKGETEASGCTWDTAVTQLPSRFPVQPVLHKAWHEGQAAVNAFKNVQWIRRQSRADALNLGQWFPVFPLNTQLSAGYRCCCRWETASPSPVQVSPVSSPEECSGSAECAFHGSQVLAFPTLIRLIILTDRNRQEVREGSKLGNGTLHLKEVSLLNWRSTLPEWIKDDVKKCSYTNSREDEVRIHLQDLTTKCWLKKETKNP